MSGAPEKLQLLGLAFAGADLVFEVDDKGVIAFVLGASESLTGRSNSQLIGSNWTNLVAEGDGAVLVMLQQTVKPGERLGPLRVAIRPKAGRRQTRHASLSVFRLPQPGSRMSCALTAGAPAALDDVNRSADGLLDRAAFDSAAEVLLGEAERTGQPVRLDLIALDGLQAATSAMVVETAERTRRHVAATLRAESLGGLGAAEVATDRFALVRAAEAPNARLAERLTQASGGITPISAELPLQASAAQNLRAMRYTLDRYVQDGPKAAAASFMASIERTVRESGRFKTSLGSGTFYLAYQPVIDLKKNTPNHFETLARFDPDSSPADTIRLATELDLIADFDLAVAKIVAKLLAQSLPDLKIAVNISAVSLMRPQFVNALIELTGFDAPLRTRLLLEVTDTHRLTDLAQANTILGEFRRKGHQICLGDFDIGAASLDYLRRLDIDLVKIDGRFIGALQSNPRDVFLLKHVAALCRDLKVSTIADLVETAETARLTRELGLDFGQGWHFGKPQPEPRWKSDPIPVRRRGVVEQWR
jgi:EAL domain-containing protein (putative c-di-GMP-specific phosphodiesterase class I)